MLVDEIVPRVSIDRICLKSQTLQNMRLFSETKNGGSTLSNLVICKFIHFVWKQRKLKVLVAYFPEMV